MEEQFHLLVELIDPTNNAADGLKENPFKILRVLFTFKDIEIGSEGKLLGKKIASLTAPTFFSLLQTELHLTRNCIDTLEIIKGEERKMNKRER